MDENGEYTTLLPPQLKKHEGKLCVVLDMDETLLHSEFETVDNDFRQTEDRELAQGDADFVLNLGADDQEEMVFVHKRPGVDAFLDTLAKHFEVIVFTAALPVYAAPVLDKVDPVSRVTHRLYRDATVTYKGQSFVKDLANFGRDAGRIVLIDNNPYAMLATPDNAMPIRSYYDDPRDRELEKITAMLMEMKDMKDVRPYLKKKFEFAKQLKAMMQMEEM